MAIASSIGTWEKSTSDFNLRTGAVSLPNCWITRIGMQVAGDGAPAEGRILAYSSSTLARVYQSTLQTFGTAKTIKNVSPSTPLRWGQGDLWAGFWVRSGDAYQYTVGDSNRKQGKIMQNVSSPPATISTTYGGYVGYEVEYTPNLAPLKGVWTSPADGSSSSIDPVFKGSTPHDAGDAVLDHTSEVHLQVWRGSDGAMVYDNLFATTQAEKDGDYFERTASNLGLTLSEDTGYFAKYRFRDSWGVYAPFSDTITFTTGEAPAPPQPQAPSGKINALGGYTYDVLYTHPNGVDAGAWQVQVYSSTGSTLLYDSGEVAVTAADGSVLSMVEFHADLAWATAYKWRARAKDSGGTWSDYSAFADFKTDSPPSRPVLTQPINNQSVQDPTFTADLSDPDGDPIAAAQIEIMDVATNAIVLAAPWAARTAYATNDERRPTAANAHRYHAQNAGTSGPTEPTWPTAAGATVRDNAGLAAVARSTAYALGAAVLKPGGTSADAEWYEATGITGTGTTAATAPVYPTTAGATVVDGEVTFTCRKTVVWQEAGSDTVRSMAVNASGTQATYAPSAGNLPYGDYKWRARADDGLGPGYGEWSGYEFFKYAQVPTATFLFPRSRVNLVRDPSAEGISAYWTETARTATDYIDRASDGDAAYGVSSWQGVADGLGNSLLGEPETVEASRAYLFVADLKKISDAPDTEPCASHLRLACYDGTGTFLGNIYPDSIQAANGADVPPAWTRYGGIVWPEGATESPALPAGTATIRPEWVPSTTASVVRADAFALEAVGRAGYPAHPNDDEWHGYADPSLFKSSHTWSGVAHDSESNLLPVLTAPAPEVAITYSSATGLAKQDDRLLIERLDGSTWTRILDTGYPTAGSDRTRIPVPGGYLKNEGRYRIKVMVRDTNDIAGETPWQQVDVRYDGPAEPLITVAQADSARAVLQGTFTPPNLTDVEFVAYEVLREAVDGSEPLEVVDVIPDPAATGFAYHFPASGKQYAISVRAVALVGSEQVEGRRSQAIMNVDYSGYYFVKDAEDPANLWVKYQVPRDTLRSLSVEPPETVYLPWGSRSPVVLTGEARPKEGALQIRLLGDLDGDSLQSRWSKIRQMEDRRRTICLLSHHPVTEKTFARFSGAAEFTSHSPKLPAFSCGWREVDWPENYYDRTGERL